MRQHRLLGVGGRRLGDEELFLVVIVEGRGLFRKQVDGGLREVEIRRHEAEFLQRQLFGADLLGAGGVFHPLLQEGVDLLPGDVVARNRVVQRHPGNPGQIEDDAVGQSANLLGARRLSGSRPRQEQEQERERENGRQAVGRLHSLYQNNARYNEGSIQPIRGESFWPTTKPIRPSIWEAAPSCSASPSGRRTRFGSRS